MKVTEACLSNGRLCQEEGRMDFKLARKPGDNEANARDVNSVSITQRNQLFLCQKAALNSAFGFPTPGVAFL